MKLNRRHFLAALGGLAAAGCLPTPVEPSPAIEPIMPNGSSAPAFSFSSDSDCGFYRTGAGTLTFGASTSSFPAFRRT